MHFLLERLLKLLQMRSVQIGAFDARQTVLFDSSGEFPSEILGERLRRSVPLAADQLADKSVVAVETFGKRDRDLVGSKEGAAEVMARLAGRNVKNLADACFDREFFPNGHLFRH